MFDVTMPPGAATMPDPGSDLISRVVGGADRAWFYWTGRESVRELERTLGIAGRALDSFESILDFGCGCGRMLLWMEELARGRALHGTDIDADAIRWCREHVPYAEVTVNDGDPPLPYPHRAFDLVFGHSVFTHLDEQRQDAWLGELRRVTSPGGLVVLSTHGEVALGDDVWGLRGRLEDEGIVFIDDVYGAEYPAPDWYQRTFHAPWYVFERWGRWFEIQAYVPGGALGVQDQILLQRRADDAPRRYRLDRHEAELSDRLLERRRRPPQAVARGSRTESGSSASEAPACLAASGPVCFGPIEGDPGDQTGVTP